MHISYKTIMLLFLFLFLPTLSESANLPSHQTIRVGLIRGDAPISFFENGQPTGIAYDTIRAIAKKNQWQLKIIPVKNEQAAYKELSSRNIDLIAGAVTPSPAHYHQHAYSLPFLFSHIGAVTKQKQMVLSHLMQELNNTFFWGILLYSLAGQLLFSFLLWINEYKTHPEFNNRSIIKGIAFANWAIISAFLRDLIFEPKTARGRFIMGLWLVCSVIFMTVLASSVTVSIIRLSDHSISFVRNKTDLMDLQIGMHSHEGLIHAIDTNKNKITLLSTEKELFEHLQKGEVQVIIDNSIMLDYYLEHHIDTPAVKSPVNFRSDYFSYAVRDNDPLQSKINFSLLSAQESGQTKSICGKYLSHHIQDCAL